MKFTMKQAIAKHIFMEKLQHAIREGEMTGTTQDALDICAEVFK